MRFWNLFKSATKHEPTRTAISIFEAGREQRDPSVLINAYRYIDNTARETGDPNAVSVEAARVIAEADCRRHFNEG